MSEQPIAKEVLNMIINQTGISDIEIIDSAFKQANEDVPLTIMNLLGMETMENKPDVTNDHQKKFIEIRKILEEKDAIFRNLFDQKKSE